MVALYALLLGCAFATTSALAPSPQLRLAPLATATRVASPPLLQDYDRLRGGSKPEGLRLKPVVNQIGGFIDRRFFLVGVAGAIGLAALVPGLGLKGGLLRPELTVTWGAPCGIFLISGLTLPTSQLREAAMRVRTHASIQAFNLALMPIVTYLLCSALSGLGLLDRGIREGMLVMAALPTTVNMCVALTRSAGGDEGVAIFNAVLGNFLGIFLSPLLLLYTVGATGAIELPQACASLLRKVLLPLVVGQLARQPLAAAVKQHKIEDERVQIR